MKTKHTYFDEYVERDRECGDEGKLCDACLTAECAEMRAYFGKLLNPAMSPLREDNRNEKEGKYA